MYVDENTSLADHFGYCRIIITSVCLLQAGQDLSRVNKLEKADILEMTVRYLKRKVTPLSSCGPDVYLAGYRQCIGQVQELLAEQWSDERRQQSGRRMVEHLEACVRRLTVPPKRRLSSDSWSSSSSSDESTRPTLGTTAQHQHIVVRRPVDLARNGASSDDDSVQDGNESMVTVVSTTKIRPTSDHPTKLQDIPTKSMWRPW